MPSDHITLSQLPLPPRVEILCCHYAVLKTWEFTDLAAPYWRWYWVDRPGSSVVIGGKRHELVPDQIVLIPPHTHFSASNRGVVGSLYIHFFLEITYQPAAPAIIILPLAAEHQQFIRDYVKRFPDLEREDVSPQLYLPLTLVSLALSLTQRECWISDYKDPRIVKAIALIESNYPAAVPNKKLSQVAGMNTNAFIRKFKQVTSRTPRQHLQALRLKEVSSLLHHSALSIEEIAERTGFNDRQHLNMIFRKQFRITPAQFRKNFLKL